MLGLLRGPVGHDGAAAKANKHAMDSVIRDINPDSDSDQSEPESNDALEQLRSPMQSTMTVMSPSPSLSSLQLNKKNSSYFGKRSAVSRASSYGSRMTINLVKEQYAIIRRECQRKLGANVSHHAFDTSYRGLLDWIRAERLTRLPHKGGSWDRVLISAQYFADQVNRLSNAIASFTAECAPASHLVFGQCLLLLELGHENAKALEATFHLFYQLGLELAPLLRAEEILNASHSVMESIGRAFSDLLSIVTGVAATYYSAVHGGRSSTRLDVYAIFGASLETFRSRVKQCAYQMWALVLQSKGLDDECQVETLLRWLAPQDSVLAFLASNRVNLTSRPEQFTCAWFQPHLSTFFSSTNKILVVEGPSGTGKTTLANWAANRLQRPIGKKTISTLSFFYNSSIMAQATSLSMLKTFLLQMLSQRIGDVELFDIIAHAHFESKDLATAEKQEERMWKALGAALRSASHDANEPLTIIADGFDEMDGAKPTAIKTLKKLHEVVLNTANVSLIQFSQPLEVPTKSSITKITLSSQNMLDDIQVVLREGLRNHYPFADLESGEQELFTEQLSAALKDSILCASLCLQYLLLQKTPAAFDQAMEYATKQHRTVADYVQKILAVSQIDSEARSLISWLVATERPLSVQEVDVLQHSSLEQHKSTMSRDFSRGPAGYVRAFMITGEGLVALRHNAIKQALISIPSNSSVSLHLKERHRDLVLRLLSSAKKHLHDEDEVCLHFYDQARLDKRLASRRLLEYTTRYWTTHFKKSSLFKVNGDLELGKDFTSAFPSSVGFVLLEAGCWMAQSFPHEAVELMNVAFRVRKALFGLDHASVVQSAVVCAIFCENVLHRQSEAIGWYAKAIKCGRTVLGAQAEIVTTLCMTLLRLSEAFVTKSRTEIMTYREEVLLVLVSSYSHRFGVSSKEVLEIYQRLAELYTFICEEEKAVEIQLKIREIKVAIHGGHSDESGSMSGHLDVVLRKHDHAGELDIFGSLFFGYAGETEESWTIVRVETMIRLAIDLIARGDFLKAEEIYLELWLKLTEHCHSILECEWHEKKIDVMIKYAMFLYERKRVEEASAVLLCCWTEYSSHQVSTFESIIVLFKELAIAMKLVGMVSIALTVFQKCWSWFKSCHKEQTTIYKEIEEHITITSKEIVKTSTTTSATTSTSTSETVIRELFESSFTSTETTEITTTTMELSKTLVSVYLKQERWSEAISVIKSTLKRTWSAFFSEAIDSIVLASSFSSESVELVVKLAQCYISQRRYEKAEALYLRLYRVHRRCGKIDDAVVIKYSELYLTFLKRYEMHNLVISFYQELLVEYRAFYGAAHTKTISILYALGDMCRHHHLTHGYWIEYYQEIITVLNRGSLICHEEALRALVIVAEHCYETARYSESLVYFKSIMATFCKFGTKLKYFVEITVIEKLLEKYYRVIEESKLEIHVHISMLKEIREACFKFFGESSSISVSITVVLADVCCRSEKYEFEAVSFYEHIMKHSKTVNTTVIKRTQSTLKSLYVKQITSSSTTVTKETIETAITMSYSRYVEIRETHSCHEEVVLTHLKELVMLYHKLSKVELAIKELRSLVIECVSKVTTSKELVETAKFIASVYISCGYSSHAMQLLRELKLQLIYGSISKGCGFSVVAAARACFAFVASFEYHLRADYSLTMASFMVELMAEYQFYQRFAGCIKTKSKMELVFGHAARLRLILMRSRRAEDFESIIVQQAVEYFVSIETSLVKACLKSSIRSFVTILLAHISQHQIKKNLIISAGHAAVLEITSLLQKRHYKDALDLTQCTYKYLTLHEGLDDPTEIMLGFHLCLMMAGRGRYKHIGVESKTQAAMLELSRLILSDVVDICRNNKIDLARCPLAELQELVALLGDLKDHARLQWLLSRLWETREAQQWSQDLLLSLGTRLVQARFLAGERTAAIRLAEDLVYNVRRVKGPRHKQTLAMYALLTSLYTSTAQWYLAQGQGEGKNKKGMMDLASLYFKKAATVHEDVLRLLVDGGEMNGSDDDDDDLDFDEADVTDDDVQKRPTTCGHAYQASRDEEVLAVRKHLRLLKLALQRLGGWQSVKPRGEFEALTSKIWSDFGKMS